MTEAMEVVEVDAVMGQPAAKKRREGEPETLVLQVFDMSCLYQQDGEPIAFSPVRADLSMDSVLHLIRGCLKLPSLPAEFIDAEINGERVPFFSILSLKDLIDEDNKDPHGSQIVVFALSGFVVDCPACAEAYFYEESANDDEGDDLCPKCRGEYP